MTLATTASDIITAGSGVGTSSNQVLLGMLVVGLILVVLYRERQQIKKNHIDDLRHQEVLANFEKEREAMNEERRKRIDFLMEVVRDNTRAMEHNAQAIDTLKDFLLRHGANPLYDGEGTTKQHA